MLSFLYFHLLFFNLFAIATGSEAGLSTVQRHHELSHDENIILLNMEKISEGSPLSHRHNSKDYNTEIADNNRLSVDNSADVVSNDLSTTENGKISDNNYHISNKKSDLYISQAILNLKEKISLTLEPFQKLFSNFIFKGVGFSFSKSLLSLPTSDFGVRIPVTSHFPKYDRLSYLPRIATLVGCSSYPFQLRWSITASLPLYSTLYGIAMIAKAAHIVKAEIINRIHKPKPTDSLTRIGVTFHLRYSKSKGLKKYIGPSFSYLPKKSVIDKVLPYVFSPAVVCAVLVDEFFYIITSRHNKQDGNNATTSLNNVAIAVISATNTMIGTSTLATNDTDTDIILDQSTKLELEKNIPEENPQNSTANINPSHYSSTHTMTPPSPTLVRRNRSSSSGFKHWQSKLLHWANAKTVGIGYAFNVLSHRDSAYGSSVQLDIQPFFISFVKLLSDGQWQLEYLRLLFCDTYSHIRTRYNNTRKRRKGTTYKQRQQAPSLFVS